MIEDNRALRITVRRKRHGSIDGRKAEIRSDVHLANRTMFEQDVVKVRLEKFRSRILLWVSLRLLGARMQFFRSTMVTMTCITKERIKMHLQMTLVILRSKIVRKVNFKNISLPS